MPVPPKDDRADKARTTTKAHLSPREREDLTCNEEQIEDLLSEGESTEDESGDSIESGKPPSQKPSPR